MSPGATWLLVLTGIGVLLLVMALWRLGPKLRRRAGPDPLSDGAVLIVSDGRVQQLSASAAALLGDCVGRLVDRVLADFLTPGSAEAIEAVGRLERTGEPIDMIVRTADGRAYELIGAPSGALIRIVLRDARFLEERLREAEARIGAAEQALREHGWQHEALQALVEDGPIIAWHRSPEGTINWSAGSIRTRTGAVTPEQAVEMIVARMRLHRSPAVAGEPQKSRIEMVVGEGTETVSLHVVEVVRPDGSRIGFATDAGTAAAAERTLTRFVQTMTETFAHLTVGLAIFDRNQTLALFNPALVQMWQVEPAWLARRPSLRDILDELRTIRRLPELEDFHAWRARLLSLFENTEAADYEELWHLADGSNIRVLARPHPHGALAFTFDDVTERVRLEQRYRHSIDLRRATMDGLTEGIAVFGANGLLQFVNQAFHAIWGTDPDTVYAAMHARQLIGLCEQIADAPETWQRLHGFITGEESRRAWTARMTTNSGRALTARFSPLPDGSALAVFSDVTGSERVAEALLERDAALDVADATREAVTALLGARRELDEIERRIAGMEAGPLDGDADCAAAALGEAAARLRRRLAEAASIASVPLLPPPDGDRAGDLAEAIAQVATLARPRAEAAGVSVAADPSRVSAPVSAPASRLVQIAFQLAAEAIARCQSGGEVVLRAEGSGEAFALEAEFAPAPPGQAQAEPSRLALLTDRQGGRLEIRDSGPGAASITCRFELRRPEHGGAPAAGSGPASSGDGKVYALKPRAG